MNTKELGDIIASEIKALKDGKSTNGKAGSIARLAQAAIANKNLEIKVAKFRLESKEIEKPVDL